MLIIDRLSHKVLGSSELSLTMDLAAYYQSNVLDISSCDSGEGWSAGNFSSSATGTMSVDTVNYKTGGSAIKATVTDANCGAVLIKALDLT